MKWNPVIRPGGEVILVDRAFSLGRLGSHEAVLLAARRPHWPYGEGAESVGGQDVLAQEADNEVTVSLGASIWPVQVALGLKK